MKYKSYFKNGSFLLREEKSSSICENLRISRHTNLCFISYSASRNYMSALKNFINLLKPTGHYMQHQVNTQ